MGNWVPDLFTLEALLRLVLSVAAGAVVGMERERGHRPAGLRTHTLVCLGSCLVKVASLWFTNHQELAVSDPLRMGAQVISGIGFLGAGTILKSGTGIRGLTTAATLWVVACIGLALGMGFYLGALVGTALTYAALVLLKKLEDKLEQHGGRLYLRMGQSDEASAKVLSTVSRVGGIVSFFEADREGDLLHINLSVRMPKGKSLSELVDELVRLEGVMLVRDR